MIGRFVISSSAVFSRTHSLVFLCASLFGLSSTSQLCRAPEASPPPCHDPRRLACSVIPRPHHRCRSLSHPGSRVHVLLVLLGDLLHHRLSSTSASVGSR